MDANSHRALDEGVDANNHRALDKGVDVNSHRALDEGIKEKDSLPGSLVQALVHPKCKESESIQTGRGLSA